MQGSDDDEPPPLKSDSSSDEDYRPTQRSRAAPSKPAASSVLVDQNPDSDEPPELQSESDDSEAPVSYTGRPAAVSKISSIAPQMVRTEDKTGPFGQALDNFKSSATAARKKKKKKKPVKTKIAAHTDAADEEDRCIQNDFGVLARNRGVTRIQSVFRGQRVRSAHGSALRRRLDALWEFNQLWGELACRLKKLNVKDQFTWLAEKNKLAYAAAEAEELRLQLPDRSEEALAAYKASADSLTLTTADELDDGNGVMRGEPERGSEQTALNATSSMVDHTPLDEVEFAKKVLEWFERADGRYKEMFVSRLEKILSGSRTYSVAKPLKGCIHPVFEAKLDAGVRILWTELRRFGEKPLVFVWFVSKHDHVSRDVAFMNDYFRRQHCSLSNAEMVNSEDGKALIMNEQDSWLLDPMGNSPLKIFTVHRHALPNMLASSTKLPLRLSKYEKSVNATKGAVLLVGRSGTGKTICLAQRITDDRNRGGRISQLFVTRSRVLRNHVARFHQDYCSTKEVTSEGLQDNLVDFLDLSQFVRRMQRVVAEAYGESTVNFKDQRLRVDYEKFLGSFYGGLDKKRHPIHPATIWTQIRTYIKGSVEAFEEARQWTSLGNSDRRGVTRDTYLSFSQKRVRLTPECRQQVYAIYELYTAWLISTGQWDDDDMTMDLLLRSKLDRSLNYTGRPTGPYDKVYVDEVQDSTEIEVVLFFLAGGMNYDRLYLAGDPAQAIVEGVDFRFEEIRSLVYRLSEGQTRVEKTHRLVTNFRSHMGILNCASAVLDQLLSLYPGSADIHGKDVGLCKGPRPGYIRDYTDGNPLLCLLAASTPSFTLICRDGDVVEVQDEVIDDNPNRAIRLSPKSFMLHGHDNAVTTIRNAKGIEYDDVIIVNFFTTITPAEHAWWKRHFAKLINHTTLTPEEQYPQMEGQLKLLYTAITRCCSRLVFVETQRSEMSEYFFRWLSGADLAEELTPSTVHELAQGATFYSHDEWKALGVTRALTAEGAGAIAALQTAIECFKKAGKGASDLLRKVRVLEEYQIEKRSFLMSTYSDGTDFSALQRAWCELLMRCLSENLFEEAAEMCLLLYERMNYTNCGHLFRDKIYDVLVPLCEKTG